jgi:hypothetical protein
MCLMWEVKRGGVIRLSLFAEKVLEQIIWICFNAAFMQSQMKCKIKRT